MLIDCLLSYQPLSASVKNHSQRIYHSRDVAYVRKIVIFVLDRAQRYSYNERRICCKEGTEKKKA